MKIPRRQFMHLAAGGAALPAVSRIACAQAYPTRPVRVIVPYAAGGATDIMGRVVGQWLSERLGQQFVIDNRPGAGTNVGTEAVVHAPSDGYSLLVCDASSAINATLYDKLNFNFIRDVAPVASIVRLPYVVLSHPSVPANTLAEFITYTKANPGKINMASAGIGSPTHVSGVLFQMMANINMTHVPYRGAAPATTDLLSGQVQFFITSILTQLIEYIRSGKLRALAVTAATRLDMLPDIPTVSEFVPSYEASGWWGVGAPKNTPTAIIERLNSEINAALDNPKIKARVADLGGTPLIGSPADFGTLIAEETEKWGKVVRAANIRAQ
jgi:tripartite-type tricarboxylate transporter receptor subunit TctC